MIFLIFNLSFVYFFERNIINILKIKIYIKKQFFKSLLLGNKKSIVICQNYSNNFKRVIININLTLLLIFQHIPKWKKITTNLSSSTEKIKNGAYSLISILLQCNKMESNILRMNIISSRKSFKESPTNYKSHNLQNLMTPLKWVKRDKYLSDLTGLK